MRVAGDMQILDININHLRLNESRNWKKHGKNKILRRKEKKERIGGTWQFQHSPKLEQINPQSIQHE